MVSERGGIRAQVMVVVIKIEDREDRLNQDGDQSVRREEQFLLMVSKGEERAHPTWIDRCSFV